MSRDNLGLFDTPPNRQEIRLAVAIVGLLFVALLIILPVRNVALGESSAFVPAVDAAMCASELMIAMLLYAQVAVFRSSSLIALATGYAFIALLLIPHALTFPGAFAADGLLGAGTSSTAWLAFTRRAAFPAFVILYAVLRRSASPKQDKTERPALVATVALLSAVAAVVALAVLATAGHDLLPPLFRSREAIIPTSLLLVNGGTIILTLSAMAVLLRRPLSVLDVWLLVSLSAWFVQTLLNLQLEARFTLGWYSLFVIMMVSSLVMMLALVSETNRLYVKLALATAAHNREREDRLMSMEAMAAAISHETGQPLSAVITSAMASRNWLDRPRPNVQEALGSVRAAIEAGDRTFKVIKSIRAMFSKGAAEEFDLNDLVRETTYLMERELAGRKVALQLALDDTMPTVRGDRVQVQRVIVNLLTNALESLGSKRGQPRTIAIRSEQLGDRELLLEITDSGSGISHKLVEQIFEPFFTTKKEGTGLGLALCRIVVEQHAGRLWASGGNGAGATFHLVLPRSGMPAI